MGGLQKGKGNRELVRRVTARADRHPAYVYLATLAEGSRGSVRYDLEMIARTLSSGRLGWQELDWSAVGYQHVAALRALLVERGKAPATVNRTLATIKGVMRQAWLLGLTPAEQYQRAREVKGVTNDVPPRGRELTHGELSAIFRACADDPSPEGARDAAVLALAYGCGLRRAEICGLSLADFENGNTLRVRGKGNRVRLAPVDNGALDALRDWITVRGHAEGALVWPSGEGKGRALVNRHMTPLSVYWICAKRGGEAQVAAFRPHDLRRTFVSHLLAAKVDLSIVSKLAGHQSVTTTTRYDMRPDEAKREGAKMLHVPYQKQKPRAARAITR